MREAKRIIKSIMYDDEEVITLKKKGKKGGKKGTKTPKGGY